MTASRQAMVALITGASSGIGRETAILLGRRGYRLVLTGRNERRLQELSAALTAEDISSIHFSGDIADSAFRKQLLAACIDAFGQLDALVNSAGIIQSDTIESADPKAYQHLMEVNVTSVMHLMQLAIPHLAEQRGSIVNVSSVAGTRSFPGIMSYCVSKAALDQLTRCAALELAEKGIRVNAVNPGVVETMLHRNSGMDDERYRTFLEHCRNTHPLGRAGQPEEIAALIAFLCSEEAGWITGATYAIDGGRALTCAR